MTSLILVKSVPIMAICDYEYHNLEDSCFSKLFTQYHLKNNNK